MKAAIATGASRGIGRAVALLVAGVMKMLPVGTSNEQGFDATFATNVRDTFNVLEQAARRLLDGSRTLTLSTSVIASSLPGIRSLRGVQGRRRGAHADARQRTAGRRITVNAVVPGATATEQIIASIQLPPLERLGTPEDIANVVSFLAGPDGGWVKGQVLRANGGYA
jgi:3-oxoacyl-[acyl-carrier protein] reductase